MSDCEYCDDDRAYIRPPRKTDLFFPQNSTCAKMNTLKNVVRTAAKAMYTAPSLLEQKPIEMMQRLKHHCDSSGQGSANPVTPQEACIAEVLESNGILLAPERNVLPTEDGLFFWYQSGGTQQKGDFVAFEVSGGVKI